MKRIFLFVMVMVLLVAFTACGQVGIKDASATPNPYEERIAELEQEIEQMQQEKDLDVAVEQDLAPNEVVTPTPVATATPEPTKPPIDNPQMYSSYAYMVSLDPATGYAGFDYFQMLTGDEAIDALVTYEGYDEVDAQGEVMNWGEGGFYEKNTDASLRTVDLSTVDIRMIIKKDGTLIDDIGNPSKSGLPDILALYNANSKYVLDYYFYFVTVNDKGVVTKVEQIYRP
ncbi:MAG: hypothetical protein AB1Z19_07725 [Eubacteriales bacterium]